MVQEANCGPEIARKPICDGVSCSAGSVETTPVPPQPGHWTVAYGYHERPLRRTLFRPSSQYKTARTVGLVPFSSTPIFGATGTEANSRLLDGYTHIKAVRNISEGCG